MGLCSAGTICALPVTPGSEGYYERACSMFDTGNYTGAIDQLHRYLGTASALTAGAGQQRAEAELLLMKAKLMRGEFEAMRTDCEAFLIAYAGSELVPQAELLLAEACFYEGSYGPAVEIYSSLPLDTFDSSVRAEAEFHYGVSLTRCGHFGSARSVFSSLRSDGKFGGKSRFYLAYLDYVEGDYRRALEAFKALPGDIAQETGTDFYVAQILFAGGRYSDVLDMSGPLMRAASLLDSPELPALAEAWRITGESAYALGDSERAASDLRRHAGLDVQGGKPTALHILGQIAYATGDYAEAEERFTPVSQEDNEIGQSALLYLGQAAAKRGDHTAAAINFDKAAHMHFDDKITETALYNYAASVAAGGRVPFGSTGLLLEEFGKRYPQSQYTAAVDEYLAIGYMSEHRYAKALEALDRIKSPNSKVRALTRQVLYELGTSELAAGHPTQAEAYLRRAVSMGGGDSLTSQCRLWLGEALYAQKKYNEAITAYKDYLSKSAASDGNKALGYYDLAYAYYQKGDYKSCRSALDKALAISKGGGLSAALRSDAMLRKADCDNYLGNVKDALAAYEAASVDGPGADYAALQAACMQGIAGDQSRKKADLEAMMRKWPDSPWLQQALYELTLACIAQGDMEGATAARMRLERMAPDSSMLRDAVLQIAAAYMDRGDSKHAIDISKSLINKWPSSLQAVTASEYLQDLYSDKGDIASYLSFIESVPGAPAPKPEEMDRLTYHSAQSALEANPNDATPMEEYLKRYPKGSYLPDALLSVAEVYRSARNSDQALEVLDRLITDHSDSEAALSAMYMKADILQGKGEAYYSEAAKLYIEMLRRGGATYAPEAYEGLMYTASSPEEAMAYADKYLALNSLTADERVQALTVKADAAIKAGKDDEALKLLDTLTTDTYTEAGGAAAVKMAEIYLRAGRAREAEKLMLAFTADGCEDADILAQGYIALADAYKALGNKKRAKQYLQALRDNYPGGNPAIIARITNALKRL